LSIKVAPIFHLSRAVLAIAAVLALSVSAFSQQEVDPTWHNPWPEPTKTIAHKPESGPAASGEKKKKMTAGANSRNKTTGPRELRARQRPKQVATTKSPSQK